MLQSFCNIIYSLFPTIIVGYSLVVMQQLLDLTGQVSELVITETNFDRLNQLLDDVSLNIIMT